MGGGGRKKREKAYNTRGSCGAPFIARRCDAEGVARAARRPPAPPPAAPDALVRAGGVERLSCGGERRTERESKSKGGTRERKLTTRDCLDKERGAPARRGAMAMSAAEARACAALQGPDHG